MEKLLAVALTKHGAFYGLLVGIMKVLKDMRDGKYRTVTALTDIVGSCIVGYVSYEVASLTDIGEYFKVMWTLFMSANAFLVIAFATDKTLFNAVIDKYLKK